MKKKRADGELQASLCGMEFQLLAPGSKKARRWGIIMVIPLTYESLAIPFRLAISSPGEWQRLCFKRLRPRHWELHVPLGTPGGHALMFSSGTLLPCFSGCVDVTLQAARVRLCIPRIVKASKLCDFSAGANVQLFMDLAFDVWSVVDVAVTLLTAVKTKSGFFLTSTSEIRRHYLKTGFLWEELPATALYLANAIVSLGAAPVWVRSFLARIGRHGEGPVICLYRRSSAPGLRQKCRLLHMCCGIIDELLWGFGSVWAQTFCPAVSANNPLPGCPGFAALPSRSLTMHSAPDSLQLWWTASLMRIGRTVRLLNFFREMAHNLDVDDTRLQVRDAGAWRDGEAKVAQAGRRPGAVMHAVTTPSGFYCRTRFDKQQLARKRDGATSADKPAFGLPACRRRSSSFS